ncbi:hypothetical protein ABSA28_00173 [Candidatus Hepatincolaceae symbiont of Richtersius coronifer]
MGFKSVRLSEEFISEVKAWADKDFRTVPQQIQYWAEVGKQKELRAWQLREMQAGLEEVEGGNTVPHEEVMQRINAILKTDLSLMP